MLSSSQNQVRFMFTKNKTITFTGAQALIQTLKQLRVDTIFGYPGGMVLDIYDELYKQNDIKHILTRHEQAAIHAAEGYAKVSGKCGVVLVTSGPGATNTITGISNAYLDGTPIVVLCGQVSTNMIGKDAFQEANICDMTKSCTKKTFQITNSKEVQSVLHQAFNIAKSGKKGPVVIDIPKNILKEQVEFENDFCSNNNNKTFVNTDLKYFEKLLKTSKAPVIVAGGGVKSADASDSLTEFSNTFNIPVVATMMGLGTFLQSSKNYFGMIGIFGENSANEILKKSDLIISLGARFNDRITCVFDIETLSEKFVQVDINEKELGRVIKPRTAFCTDVNEFLTKLNQEISNIDFLQWLNTAQDFKNLNKTPQKNSNMLHSFEVFQLLENFTKNKNVIFTTEVGQHQLWAVRNLSFNKERQLLVSGGAGTMGYGLPAAIGAAVANPEKSVVCIAGDGSFQMSLNELATIKDYNLNIKILVINNGYLGMVRQLQEKFCEKRYSQTKISNPDFINLAKAYSIEYEKVSTQDDFTLALNKIFSDNSPHLTEILVEPLEVL